MRHTRALGIFVAASFGCAQASIEFANNAAKFLLAEPTSQISLPTATQVYAVRSVVKKKEQIAVVSPTQLYATSSYDLLSSTSTAVACLGLLTTTTVNQAHWALDSIPELEPWVTTTVDEVEAGITTTYNYIDTRITATISGVDTRITSTMNQLYSTMDGFGLIQIEPRITALEVGLTATYNYLDNRITQTIGFVDDRITTTMNQFYAYMGTFDLSVVEPRVTALETNLTNTYNYLDNRITTTIGIVDTRITNTMNDVHQRIDDLGVPLINARLDTWELDLTKTYTTLDGRITTTIGFVDQRITTTMNKLHADIGAINLDPLTTQITLLETNLTNTYNYLDNRITTTIEIVDDRITTTMNQLHAYISTFDLSVVEPRVTALETNLTNTYNYLDNRITTTIGIVDTRITNTMNDVYGRLDSFIALEGRVTVVETNLTNTYNYLDDRITTTIGIVDNRITITMDDVHQRIDDLDVPLIVSRLDQWELDLTEDYTVLDNRITQTIGFVDQRITTTMNDVHQRIDGLGVPLINSRLNAWELDLSEDYTTIDNCITQTIGFVDQRISLTIDNVYQRIFSLDVPSINMRMDTWELDFTKTYTTLDNRITTTVDIVDARITATLNDLHDRIDHSQAGITENRISNLETNLTCTYLYLDASITITSLLTNTRITNTMNDFHIRTGNSPAGLVATRVDNFGYNLSNMYITLGGRLDNDAFMIVRANEITDDVNRRVAAGLTVSQKPVFRLPDGMLSDSLSGQVTIEQECYGFDVDCVVPMELTLKDGAWLHQGENDIVIKPTDIIVVEGKGNKLFVTGNIDMRGHLILAPGAELIIVFEPQGYAILPHFYFNADAQVDLRGDVILSVEGAGILDGASSCEVTMKDISGQVIEQMIHRSQIY